MPLIPIFAGLAAAIALAAAPDGTAAASAGMTLVILGTGTPNADPARSGPALAIIVDDEPYIVDAGAGVVRRAAAAERAGEKSLAAKNLDTVFLTHLHSDHTIGLPDLLLTPWVLEREAPLAIYGPRGTKRMAKRLGEAYAEDVKMRLGHLQPATPEGWKTDIVEIAKPGRIFERGALAVDAVAVPHGGWKRAYGFKFSAYGKTIVVSGDTARSEAMIDAARGADILVHEVISDAGLANRPPEWRRYHEAYHTSASELAEIARETKPGLLILYHQLYDGDASAPDVDERLVAEIRAAGYEGEIVSARDLMVFQP